MRIEGRVINHDSDDWAEVEINPQSGLIQNVSAPSGRADLKLGKHQLLFPGFGDVHVHAREDESGSQTYKEDFRTLSAAAVNGGVVQVADMPNNHVPPTTAARYAEKKQLAARADVCVTLYAGIGPTTEPLPFPAPYKVFMGPSIGDLFFTDNTSLDAAIVRYSGQNVSFHAEDPAVMEAHKDEPTHEAKRPAAAETAAVEFALGLIKKYNLQGKFCHVSTESALEKIASARRDGESVTTEITPHHLYFDTDMLTAENRSWLRMNPPLRRREDRLALIDLLRRGEIDYLATDHAPHTIEEKRKGTSGVPHLDTVGPFAAWLMAEHSFTPQDIARVASYNPGQFVRPFLPPELGRGFGRIAEGYAGSLTVLDPDSPIKIEKSMLKTKCGWSPFEGITFPGRVVYTVLRGNLHQVP